MFSVVLAAVLSQAPAVAPVASVTSVLAPVEQSAPVSILAPLPDANAVKEGKKVAKYEGREGCVEQTGSRIKRRDKATCNNGRSISQEDIERAGGQFGPAIAPPIPAAAGY